MMRRLIITMLVVVLSWLGFTTSAQADTALCNSSFGKYCGKVEHTGSSDVSKIHIVGHNGQSVFLPRGANSRMSSYYIRDVHAFYVPSNCKAVIVYNGTGYSGTKEWNYIGDRYYFHKVTFNCQ